MYKFPCTFMQTFLISGSHMLIFISELFQWWFAGVHVYICNCRYEMDSSVVHWLVTVYSIFWTSQLQLQGTNNTM